MKQKVSFIRTTVVGGVLFLAPLVVTLFVLEKAWHLAGKFVAPIVHHFPPKILGFIAVSDLLAVGILVLVCFIAGLIARTALAKRVVEAIEHGLLSNIPGYEFFKGLGESILGVDKAGSQAVLVHFDDCSQIGFLMEHLQDGTCVVFLPGAPSPFSGGVFYFSPDRVQAIEAPPQTVLKSLKRLGVGSVELAKGIERR
ncbi:DUF502 domain-containing protein [Niveibacterium sp. SC-1]|uniref:DUF502 domain-containing protein n=1 Tax=Niveibacterium sp. SC-1 TaxID=3135646 RepID=UPI00311E6C32